MRRRSRSSPGASSSTASSSLRRGACNVQQGTMLRWGGGVGVLLGSERQLQIGPEVSGALVMPQIDHQTTNVEGLIGVRYRLFDDFEIGAGAGPGFTKGLGTPNVRGVFSLAFTPDQKPPPGDQDR